jgi:hypothetical protein
MSDVIVFQTENQKTMEINPHGNNNIHIFDSSLEELYYVVRDEGFSYKKRGSSYELSFAGHRNFYRLNPQENYKIVFNYVEEEKEIICNFFIEHEKQAMAYIVVYNPNAKKKIDPKLVIFYENNTKFETAPNEKYIGEELIYAAVTKKKEKKIKKKEIVEPSKENELDELMKLLGE